MLRLRSKRLHQFGAVVTAAVLLKLFYSSASVNGLRWILAPTTLLVELVTGENFRFEPYAGYINEDHSFLIADSCSGVNFMIAAFLMLAFLILAGNRQKDVRWLAFVGAAAAAYIAALAANTVRIVLALKQHGVRTAIIWMNPEQMHRLQGIFVYFGFLMLLYLLYEKIANSDGRKESGTILIRPLLPLLIYWLITLGVPILNGAYREGGNFAEHIIFVTITPLVLLAPFVLVDRLQRKLYTLTDRGPIL